MTDSWLSDACQQRDIQTSPVSAAYGDRSKETVPLLGVFLFALTCLRNVSSLEGR